MTRNQNLIDVNQSLFDVNGNVERNVERNVGSHGVHGHVATKLRAGLAALLVGLVVGAGLGLAPAGLAAAATRAPALEMTSPVDINRAGIDELQKLPGVGKARAQAIVDMRKERGGFKSVDELLDVRGIGDVMLERMRPHVSVGAKPAPGR